MRKNKTELKKAINAIIDRDDETAKSIIREAIQTDARYIAYQDQLKKYGFTFEKVDVPEELYLKIEEIIAVYHPEAQKKIIDEVYKQICRSQN